MKTFKPVIISLVLAANLVALQAATAEEVKLECKMTFMDRANLGAWSKPANWTPLELSFDESKNGVKVMA